MDDKQYILRLEITLLVIVIVLLCSGIIILLDVLCTDNTTLVGVGMVNVVIGTVAHLTVRRTKR